MLHKISYFFCFSLVAITFGSQPSFGVESSIKTIGVISTIGDKLDAISVGALVFGNSRAEIDTRDWDLGRSVTAATKNALSSRFDVRVLSDDDSNLDMENAAPATLASNIRALIKPEELAAFDAFLVIYPSKRSDTICGTNGMAVDQHALTGIGICRNHSLVDAGPHLFAACKVALVDAHTFAIVRESWLERPRDDSGGLRSALLTLSTLESHDFSIPLAESAWPSADKPVDSLQKAAIQSSFQYLLQLDLTPTLQELELAQ
jgi:hypothetical protein